MSKDDFAVTKRRASYFLKLGSCPHYLKAKEALH